MCFNLWNSFYSRTSDSRRGFVRPSVGRSIGWSASVRHARVEKWENMHFRPYPPGLILVILLTEPVGLAPHILTEPDRKTMSPVKMSCQILLSYQPRFLITATAYMMQWKNIHYSDDSVSEKSKNESKFSNILLNQFERFRFIPIKESQPGSELAKHVSPRAK